MQLTDSNIMKLIITMASSTDQKEFARWNTLLLEIVHLIFINRDPDDILSTTVCTKIS